MIENVFGNPSRWISFRRNLTQNLRGSLVGESETEDVGRIYAQNVHEIGIPVCQGLGLACAGSGYHADPSLGGGYRLRLAGIEV